MRHSFLVIALFAMVLGGCMMMGMGGGMMGWDGQPRSLDIQTPERIVREMIFGDYRLVADFPPLNRHQESLLSLRTHSSNDSLSIALMVRLIITLGEQEEGIEHVLLEEILTPSTDGRYEFSFTPHAKGFYHITFLVEQLGDTNMEKPFILSATQEVKATDMSGQSGSKISTLLIVGAAGMVVMMIVMMGIRF